jgi:hypothetical protein
MAGEGYLENNRRLDLIFDCSCSSRMDELIFLMKNLEELKFLCYELTPDALAHVFQSCSKLTKLLFTPTNNFMREMTEHLKNQLRSGFQRLRRLTVVCFTNDTWPVIQEMLT